MELVRTIASRCANSTLNVPLIAKRIGGGGTRPVSLDGQTGESPDAHRTFGCRPLSG